MLPDRPEARKKFLRTFWILKTTHATLTFTRWLWLFSARLFARAAALTNPCFTLASSGISTFAAE